MTKVGYILKTVDSDNYLNDIKWMKNYECNIIIEEEMIHEKLRPEWKCLLSKLERGDEIVIVKLSNAIRGTRELAFFLEFCRVKAIRIISIHDRIDSKDELFPETKMSHLLSTIAAIPEETAKLRRELSITKQLKNKSKPLTMGRQTRMERNKTIINMYKSGYAIDDILGISGFRSRSSIFRIIKEAESHVVRRRKRKK